MFMNYHVFEICELYNIRNDEDDNYNGGNAIYSLTYFFIHFYPIKNHK